MLSGMSSGALLERLSRNKDRDNEVCNDSKSLGCCVELEASGVFSTELTLVCTSESPP